MADPISFRRRRRQQLSPSDVRSTVWLGLILGLLAAQTASVWPDVPSAIDPARASQPASPGLVRVVDGDTFRYADEPIRIVGIDTPETHPARCAFEAELGERATRRLAELLAAGPFELVPIDRDEDRYGRKLRRVVRNGRDIGDILIAEGLARPYDGGARAGWCG